MTIEQLINARGAVSALYQAQVDGRTALKIRKAVRQMEEPLKDYDEALKAWVESEKIDGMKINELTKEQEEYWMEMVQADVDVTWDAPLGVDDLDGVSLSAAQIDLLVTAGLVRDDEVEDVA